jgi:hypothetical protein
MGRICDLCNTDLGDQTDYNFNKHRNKEKCKENQLKKKLIEKNQSTLNSFFKINQLKPSGKGNKDIDIMIDQRFLRVLN